jgi:hypothetical protein
MSREEDQLDADLSSCSLVSKTVLYEALTGGAKTVSF